MRNIFNMNMFRMKKARLAYIFGGVAILLTLFIFALNWLMDLAMSEMFDMPDMVSQSTNIFSAVIIQNASSVAPIIVLMFIMLFFNTVISTGYEKNLIGYEGNKFACAGANIAASAVYGIIIAVATTAVSFLISAVCYAEPIFEDGGKFFAYFIVSFIEMIAYIMLVMALSDMKGRYILGMILSMLYLFYNSLIYNLIDLAVDYFFDKSISIGKYTLLGCMKTFDLTNTFTDYLISGLIASAVLVIAYFLDVYALTKREMK